MREGAKQRLIGAAVVVALVVIFVPMLFEDRADPAPAAPELIPPAPAFDADRSEVFLGPADSGVGGLKDADLTDSEPLALPPAGDLEPAPLGGPAELAPEPPTDAVEEQAAEAAAEPVPAAAQDSETPSAPPPARADGLPSWVVQVASVATPDGAAELEGKLRKGGFSAFVEKAEVNGKLYYRVRVGPEADRAGAEKSAAALRERYKVDTLVTSYP